MKTMMLLLVVLTVACTSQPPAAAPNADSPRMATEILYVGVPTMNVYATPSDTASVITTYGYTETVSVLARQGAWAEVRTVAGTGWARTADLISAADVQPLLNSREPRFLTAPVAVPQPRARGEIVFEAKVNTDGDVVSIKTVKNTTGSKALEKANAAALQEAKFYPIVEKGQRLTFTYEYDVKY